MMNTKMMNDEMLRKVTGGDNGDTYKEIVKDMPLYSVGQVVKVYISGLHLFSRQATVLAVNYNTTDMKLSQFGYQDHYFNYTVEYSDGKQSYVLADDIVS